MTGKIQEQSAKSPRQPTATEGVTAVVFNIQRYCIHDGPGIRTTVFLKGCSLSCWWCANPEAINSRPELGFAVSRCTGCGLCVTACPEGAFVPGPSGKPSLDRDRCTACGECVPVC
ncbi:MAG: 4Fe-4S binding protein, partial [Chloroflexi bacterium]|nr:4Fe-4S binding protein [Chloroflexota bacterium]